jgi:hypothetical protein
VYLKEGTLMAIGIANAGTAVSDDTLVFAATDEMSDDDLNELAGADSTSISLQAAHKPPGPAA